MYQADIKHILLYNKTQEGTIV